MSLIRQLWIVSATLVVGGFIFYGMLCDISSSSWSNKASGPLLNLTKKNSPARSLVAYREDKRIEGNVDIKFRTNSSRNAISKSDFKTAEITKSSVRTSFRKRTLRRRKREVRNQNYAWNFTANVARFNDKSTEFPLGMNETGNSDSQHEKPNPNLGVAIQVEGDGSDKSYNEMHHAWNSVDDFLKLLFREDIEKLKIKGHDIIVDPTGLQNKTKEENETKFDPKNESRLSRDKKGKFLFGLLGIGGSSENPPMDQGSEEEFEKPNSTLPSGNIPDFQATSTVTTEESITLNSMVVDMMESTTQLPFTGSNFEDLSTATLSTEFITVNSTGAENIEATQMFPSQDNSTEMQITSTAKMVFGIQDLILAEHTGTIASATEFVTLHERDPDPQFEPSASVSTDSQFVSDFVSEVNATTEGNEFKIRNITLKINESNEIEPEKTLTAADIKEFCISLFSRKPKNIPRLLIEFSDNEGNGVIVLKENGMSSRNVSSHNQISKDSSDNQSPRSLGFTASVVRTGAGSKFVDSDGDEILSINGSPEGKDAKLFISNLFPSFGSGRSAELDELDNNENLNIMQNTTIDILSVADCENFFRNVEMPSTSAKPRALDVNDWLITDKFEDLSLQTEGVLHNEHTITTLGDKGKSFNIFGFGSGFSDMPEEIDTNVSFNEGSGESLMGKDLSNDQETEPNPFASNTTQESRFVFGLWNFGSGDRSTDVSPTDSNSLGKTTDRERSFGWVFGFGSGDRSTDASPTDSNSLAKTTDRERSFGWVFGFGSGDREVADVIEPTSGEQILKGTLTEFSTGESTEYSTKLMETDTAAQKMGATDMVETNPTDEILFTNTFDLESNDLNTSTERNGVFLELDSGDTEELPEIVGKEDLSSENVSIAVSEVTFKKSTENNQPKLLGSLFLSGSGDGATINLVQESTLTSSNFPPAAMSRRGKALDDIPDYWQEESPNISRRRGRLENNFEDWSVPSVAQTITENVFDGFHGNTGSEKTLPNTELNSSAISRLDQNVTNNEFVPVSSTISNVMTSTLEHQMSKSEEIICSSDGACKKSLNERCIPSGGKAICGCGKSFMRHPETGKCEAAVLLETSMKLPGEVFHKDLKDETSELFQKKRKEAIDTISAFLARNPKLLSNIAKVEVTFEEGSLIVKYNIVYVAEGKENVSEVVEQVEADIQAALNDDELLTNIPLNVSHANLSVSAVDQCKMSELNYCSEDADCIPDEVRGFRCQCKDAYLDNSRDKTYAGEICIATCPPSYCGDNGLCDLRENGERHCLCSGWYFGVRCEVSGIVLIGGFAALNVLVVFIVVVAVCFCKKRRNRRTTGYYGENEPDRDLSDVSSPAASARITDDIALNDVGPDMAMKYVAISTPIPAINIIEPSLPRSFIGSTSTYELDSTFDRTPSSGDENQSERL